LLKTFQLEELRYVVPKLCYVIQKEEFSSLSALQSFIQVLKDIASRDWSFTYQRIPSSVFPVLTKMEPKNSTFHFTGDNIPSFVNVNPVDQKEEIKLDRYNFISVFELHSQFLDFMNQFSSSVQIVEADIMNNVDLWLLHESVIDTIQLFREDHIICAEQLVNLPIPVSHRSKIIVVRQN
jgi:hypothetical protein